MKTKTLQQILKDFSEGKADKFKTAKDLRVLGLGITADFILLTNE